MKIYKTLENLAMGKGTVFDLVLYCLLVGACYWLLAHPVTW